jgi:glycosyltransferase involved in cell wall biosynthesis
MLADIRRLAGPTVSVLGPQPFAALRHHYAHCRALIFPGEEDFGMVPVEAMASGRPVVAFGRGGATETVARNLTGVFFDEQTVDAITDAVSRLSTMEFDSDAIVAHAARFNRDQFVHRMRAHIDALLAQRDLAGQNLRDQSSFHRQWAVT